MTNTSNQNEAQATTSASSKGKLPSHDLFHITGNNDDSQWTKIGAAWTHQDGKGFSLQIDLMPTNANRFALREAKPKANSEDNA